MLCATSRHHVGTTPPSPSRPSTSSSPTSAIAPSTTCGGRCWNTSTPPSSASPRRPRSRPSGFFNQNLVMEYPFEQAVADGVNVDFDLYTSAPLISKGHRDQRRVLGGLPGPPNSQVRWEQGRPRTYPTTPKNLTAASSPRDQIRTIIRTFPATGCSPRFSHGRTEVPKTLIFAKDDSHADDIVTRSVREEFGKGNEFAQKITYRT